MTPQQLVAGGFERFQVGLSARFGVNGLKYAYSYAPDHSSLSVCLAGPLRSGEVFVQSSGLCRLSTIGGLGRPFMHSIDLGDSDDGFHQLLASLFLYVTEKRSFDELWPNRGNQQSQ